MNVEMKESLSPLSIPHSKVESIIASLRVKVAESIKKHSYPTAIFFSDKLVTMSKNEPEDIFRLAECYFLNAEYNRSLHLLEKHNLVYSSLQTLHLAAQAMAKSKQWEECLDLLGDGETIPDILKEYDQREEISQEDRGLLSSISLIRGNVFNALENRNSAAHWYKEALKHDVYCYEAFEHLIENHMLTSKEETEVLDQQLKFSPEEEWLKLLCSCKLKKYDITLNSAAFQELSSSYELDSTNKDILTAQADVYYYTSDFQKCYDITKKVLEQDPYNHGHLMTIHISTLVELKLKSELFYCSHRLVEQSNNTAIAWYAVGCYYFIIENYDAARRFFNKATTLEPLFGPGWIAFGHAFAAQGENDQAMAAYRSASRMLSGYHLPALCIGMELIRVNNFNLAEQYISQAKETCSTDPLIFNELGVIYYKNKQYEKAKSYFLKVLELCSPYFMDTWEPTIFNLAHCYRKTRHYSDAIDWYQKALSISPKNPGTYSALGYSHHLQGNLDTAIEYYHRALGLRADDTFTTEMLNIALEAHISSIPSSSSFSSSLDFLSSIPPSSQKTRMESMNF